MKFFSFILKKNVDVPDESLCFCKGKKGKMLARGVFEGIKITKSLNKKEYESLKKKIDDIPKVKRSNVLMKNKNLLVEIRNGLMSEQRGMKEKGFGTKEIEDVIIALRWIDKKYWKYNGEKKNGQTVD